MTNRLLHYSYDWNMNKEFRLFWCTSLYSNTECNFSYYCEILFIKPSESVIGTFFICNKKFPNFCFLCCKLAYFWHGGINKPNLLGIYFFCNKFILFLHVLFTVIALVHIIMFPFALSPLWLNIKKQKS